MLISILRLNLVLTYGIPPGFRGDVHLLRYDSKRTSNKGFFVPV